MTDAEIEHQVEVSKKVWNFLEEVGTENYYKIDDIKDPEIITTIKSHVAENLLKWHSEGKISFASFCDRKSELKELVRSFPDAERVEIHGIGGVGKTSLIHVALLILKLKGYNIISLGPEQEYISGSGYAIFKNKCGDYHHSTLRKEEITLADVIDALSKFLKDPDDLKKEDDDDVIIDAISGAIKKNDLIVFIDDVHLASKAVRKLILKTKSLIMSARQRTGLASKEIGLMGIPGSDRKALINLISEQYSIELSYDMKEKISTLAEGHPVATELIIRNYNTIDLDELERFIRREIAVLEEYQQQAEEFLKRLVEEILSEDEFSLLKDLSVLNTELDTNISRKVIKQLYKQEDFLRLISKGLLKKREGKENIHEFTFHLVQETLNDEAESINHENAIKYYEKKREILGETIDDAVEMLYHQLRVKINTQLREAFLELSEKVKPVHLGFKRMIDIGLLLEDFFKDNDAQKAPVLRVLGNLYLTLNRYGEAKKSYLAALETYMELAEKSPETFKPDVADTQNNLGVLYQRLNRYGEAEKSYLAALETYKELAEKSPETFKPKLAETQNNLGVLYQHLSRYGEAEKSYLAALETYKELAEKSPETFKPKLATTQNNLGVLYQRLNRYGEAEESHLAALKIRKELAEKSPETFKPKLADTLYNLGVLYQRFNRNGEAEEFYLAALETYKELAEKSPETFKSDVADTQNNLGVLYQHLSKYGEAEKFYLSALKIRKELAEKSPETFKPKLADTLYNLEILSKIKNRNGKT